jgi:hypothetical protein
MKVLGGQEEAGGVGGDQARGERGGGVYPLLHPASTTAQTTG